MKHDFIALIEEIRKQKEMANTVQVKWCELSLMQDETWYKLGFNFY